MLKYREIVVYDLNWNTVLELRNHFSKAKTDEPDCNISIGTEADIDTKDAINIYCDFAGYMPESHLDTKIIAKVAKIRMSLN